MVTHTHAHTHPHTEGVDPSVLGAEAVQTDEHKSHMVTHML